MKITISFILECDSKKSKDVYQDFDAAKSLLTRSYGIYGTRGDLSSLAHKMSRALLLELSQVSAVKEP